MCSSDLGVDTSEQGNEQRRASHQYKQIYTWLGAILQAGRHEANAQTNGRMAEEENPGYLLEAVEESKDAIPHDTSLPPAGMEGARNGKLPQRCMESRVNAEFCAYQ